MVSSRCSLKPLHITMFDTSIIELDGPFCIAMSVYWKVKLKYVSIHMAEKYGIRQGTQS